MELCYTVTAGVLVSPILFAGCGQTGTIVPAARCCDQDAGANTQATTLAATAPNFEQADAAYRAYAIEQCDTFVEKTEEFTNAVKAGELDKAKALYAPARMYYERIEPIAKSEPIDAALEKQIGERFAALQQEWAPFKKGEGYVSYTELKPEEIKKLSQNLDALAETLYQMGKLLGM